MKAKTFWLLSVLLFLSNPVFSQVTSSYVFSQAQFATGPSPVSVIVGDFNGDGRLDLAVANASGGSISVLLGKPDGTFAPKMDYATGTTPWSVVAADFNGDGKPDLAVANTNDNTTSILLGNGDGAFQSHIDLPVGLGPRSVAVGDFNGDGKADLAVANQTDNTVSILLGYGNGTFQPSLVFAAGSSPTGVAVADFNSDGKLDLAVATSGTFSVATLQGNGDGTFQAPMDHTAVGPYNSISVAAADLNGDGIPDLAVAATRSGFSSEDYVSVLLGNGDGTFRNSTNYTCVRFVSSIITADFNGDGKLDLVVGTSYGDPQSLSVLINKGDGTFKPHTDYSAGFAPISVAAGDFNGDGKQDLVTANDQDNNVAVLLGTGDGTFQPRSDYATGNSSQGITTADFNGDGKVDLVTADCSENAISVLLAKGDGTFQGRISFATGRCPVGVDAGDFNGDGRMDLAVANQTDVTLSVLLGNGDGTFQLRTDYPVVVAPSAIAVADLNGDKKLDVVVLNDGLVSIFLGTGDGSFQPRMDISNLANGGSMAVGDLNGDGLPDLATTDQSYSGTLAISLGNGDGTFRVVALYTLPFTPDAVTVGDFNRDGKLDLAVAQGTYYGFVSVLLGIGDGTFRAPVQFSTNRYPRSVVTADFDGDGVLDLALGGGGTSILLGNGDGTFQTHMDNGGGTSAITTADFDGDGRQDIAVAAGSFVSVFLNKPAANPIGQPAIRVSPTQITFPPTLLNTTSSPVQVTISNTGTANLEIFDISTQDPFAISNPSSNITSSIAPNTQGTFDVLFRPTTAGPLSGNVTIQSNAPTSLTTISAQGTGSLPPPPPTITSVLFEAIDSVLDPNPNAGGELRIFPDKQGPQDAINRAKVRVKASLTVPLPGVTIFFKSFDVDDPSTDLAPVDPNGHAGDDNRGSPNCGVLTRFAIGSAVCAASTTTDDHGIATVPFEVTMQPGDNFKIVASLDQSYLNTLYVDGIDLKEAGGGLVPLTQRTKMLTVWRRVHVEVDSMGLVQDNVVQRNILQAQTGVQTELSVNQLLTSNGESNNRFANGKITIQGIGSFRVIKSAKDSLTVDGSIRNSMARGRSFALYDDDNFDSSANGDWHGLNGDAGKSVRELPETFSLIQDSDDPSANIFAPAYIRPIYDGGGSRLNNTSNVTFKLNLSDNGLESQLAAFQTSCINDGLTNPGACVERDDFWVVYEQLGYQPATAEDLDPDNESAKSGLTRTFKNETIDDVNCFDANYHEPVGGTGSIIYLETARDQDRILAKQPEYDADGNRMSEAPVHKRTTAHEMGHQFGLDGGETVAKGLPTHGFGIMSSPGFDTKPGIIGLFWEPLSFTPRHLNILRCRQKSPGRGPGDP
jgi:hypothetical protein